MIVWTKLLGNVDIIVKLLGGLAIVFLALLAKCNNDRADEYLTQVNTIREIHSKEINSNGDTIYITKQEYYTRDNLRESEDPVIVQLLKQFDNLKLRKVEQLFTTNAHIRTEYITDVVRDTIIVRDSIMVNVSEFDVYDDGSLHMERVVLAESDGVAHYKYDYNTDLSGAISWDKEGSWKIKNLWKWRPKIWRVNLNSTDKNLVIKDSKFIYVGNKRD